MINKEELCAAACYKNPPLCFEVSPVLALLLLALFPSPSLSADPSPAVLSSPALLIDYHSFSRDSERFNRRGTESRAVRDLVEILYDWDNNRPWGADYFPEANARLKAFRETVCAPLAPQLPAPVACLRPAILWGAAEVKQLQAAMLDPASLATIATTLGFEVSPWVLPFRENAFNLVIGAKGEEYSQRAKFWNIPESSVPWKTVRHTLVNDKDNYRAGFEQKDFPALLSYGAGGGMLLNDWLLRLRALGFAADFKHAVGSSRRWNPANPIVDAKERLFLALFAAHGPELEAFHATLLPKVTAHPEHLSRWEKDRAEGDFAEELYQQLSYKYLRELTQLQGSYFAVAKEARKHISPRQQALESLLTVQRYHSAPRFLAMEMLTLMEPLTSHAYVLDAAADMALAQAFTMEQLKALLGIDNYQGEALYPAIGGALAHPELFRESYLDEYAPDIKKELAGRDFLKLDSAEQIRILTLYLIPAPGKYRPQALYRVSALWLGTASDADLRKLADVVHGKRFP